MKHPTSRLLHAYWDRLRGERSAPERSEIEPGAIRNLLADSLILEIEAPAEEAVIRIGGTRLCAMFGRELRDTAFAGLWGDGMAPSSLAHPQHLVETVACDRVGLIAGLKGRTRQGEALDLELLLLPLRHRGRTRSRLLGALSPFHVPHWFGLRPIVRLEAVSQRVLRGPLPAFVPLDPPPGERMPLIATIPPPANDSRPWRRGHLMVHPGGRT
ncbi:PAS domain-containing protein [Methylobacterium organophilum]|uniref:PAS domain-containing protein n=1 Tax=Methylobacterium organophilum TaxID=410 RepID=UPI001F1376C3|nr:PAS domain-containing protein [Methylobacterium organophilum]UMY17715.1 PAS domain-containing protein [Methylobacterium organophilum]